VKGRTIAGRPFFLLAHHELIAPARQHWRHRRRLEDPEVDVETRRRGKRIAYVNYPEGTLWSARLDGTQDPQLTFPPMEVSFPSWAPDGRRLAFNGRVNGGRWKIYAMPAEGGTPEQLIPGEASEVAAEWSPDNSRIVFSGSPFFDPGTSAPTTLRFLDLETRRITDVPGSEGVWAARWSPDGRYIVAHRFDSVNCGCSISRRANGRRSRRVCCTLRTGPGTADTSSSRAGERTRRLSEYEFRTGNGRSSAR
jgi:dipeptidyl aminopeptidase/acylaminoacyl peptidase